MITENEMLQMLMDEQVALAPLSLRCLQSTAETGSGQRLDAVIEMSWGDRSARFVVELKALSTPKAFQDAVNRLRAAALPRDLLPLVILPHLSETQLEKLEKDGINGIDLCGNGIVVVPNSFAVSRSGGANRFPTYAPIKNIYQKNSSMVGRMFLVRPKFDAVRKIQAEINRRNLLVARWGRTPMSLATVSKALKTLQEDLIVGRSDGIRLLQADQLLDRLSQNYAPPKARDRIQLKLKVEPSSLLAFLSKQSQEVNVPIMASGVSSVSQYAAMQRGEMISIYCPRLEPLVERMPGSRTDRFPDVELIETQEQNVYFDAREDGEFRWASPVQVYLELMRGDKRDQETAEQVRGFILTALKAEQQ